MTITDKNESDENIIRKFIYDWPTNILSKKTIIEKTGKTMNRVLQVLRPMKEFKVVIDKGNYIIINKIRYVKYLQEYQKEVKSQIFSESKHENFYDIDKDGNVDIKIFMKNVDSKFFVGDIPNKPQEKLLIWAFKNTKERGQYQITPTKAYKGCCKLIAKRTIQTEFKNNPTLYVKVNGYYILNMEHKLSKEISKVISKWK